MKKSLVFCIVALGALATAHAQTPSAGTARDAAQVEKDADRIRADLEAARKRLDEAAREVAHLSQQLGRGEAGRDVLFFDSAGPRHAVLGLQLDPQSGKQGARVIGVSPGGAAAEAGVLEGDVIVNIDGRQVAGKPEPGLAVIEHMREVQPEQKVRLKVLRDGRNKDFTVVARPMVFAGTRFLPAPGHQVGGAFMGAVPAMRAFPGGWHREFGGLELASLTPKLGAYFGATEGVLVVQAPDNEDFKLEDGDVIQSIDGRKPEDGAHALRILRSYRGGEKLALSILRQRKALKLEVTMPERPEFDHVFAVPPSPSGLPALPPPPVPPTPGSGAGTLE